MRLAPLLLALAGCGLPVASAVPPRPQSGPPDAPTDLSVRPIDRRATDMEVCWTAASRFVGHYELRVAKFPITPENFDDPAAGVIDATKWPARADRCRANPVSRMDGTPGDPICGYRPSAGSTPPESDEPWETRHMNGLPGPDGQLPVPGAPGERQCYVVRGLYIENDYYFAVRAVGDGPPPPAAMEPTS